MGEGDAPAMTGFSITVFLPDGEPDGLRLVERSHWTGIGLMTRRDRLEQDLKRDEFKRSGVYALLGPAEGGLAARRIYVGEGNVVATRVREHVEKKEFWTELVLFTKKDDSLDKADISYLEAELVKLAKAAGRAELDNTQDPNPPEPTEAKRADIDSFLGDMLAIFRLLGIDAFEPIEEIEVEPGTGTGSETYVFTLGGTNGRGTPTRSGFLVREGSKGRAQTLDSISSGYASLRQTLIDSSVARVDGEDLIFLSDYEFKSASAAAASLYGGMTSGPQQWKRDSDGKSIKDIEAERLREVDDTDTPVSDGGT